MTGPSPAVDGMLDLGPDDADIVDPDTYTAGVPHATFLRLRRDDPVSWWDEPQGHGFWAVTRHADLLHVSRNVDAFSSAQGVTLEEMDPDDFTARRNMLEYDPPEHTRYRRLVSKPFSRREVYAYEGAIRLLARAVLDDALPPGGSLDLDFVESIAKQLPMRMLGRLAGRPRLRRAMAGRAWRRAPRQLRPGLHRPPGRPVRHRRVQGGPVPVPRRARPVPLRRRASGSTAGAAHRRRDHRSAGADDRRRSADRARVQELLRAPRRRRQRHHPVHDDGRHQGPHRTTRPARPAPRRDRRAATTALVDSAVEEILRWATVTMHFRRTATRDTELGGRAIRAGDKVVIWYVSADYDDAAFADPFVFDIHRNPNPQVAFGLMSPHLCLGAQLARMEIKILFQELLPRLAGARIAGPVERMRSNFIAGVKRLPVEFALA